MIDFDPIINKTYTLIRKKSSSLKTVNPFLQFINPTLKKW